MAFAGEAISKGGESMNAQQAQTFIERWAERYDCTIPEALKQIEHALIYRPEKAKGPLPEGPIENNSLEPF